ncbi:hypothetical protein ACFQ0M_04465 [Kitasatospora aburaviensis]
MTTPADTRTPAGRPADGRPPARALGPHPAAVGAGRRPAHGGARVRHRPPRRGLPACPRPGTDDALHQFLRDRGPSWNNLLATSSHPYATSDPRADAADLDEVARKLESRPGTTFRYGGRARCTGRAPTSPARSPTSTTPAPARSRRSWA